MADATWLFEVDWDRDGDWDDAYEDISAYVMGAQWNLGMREAYQDVADETRLTLTLRNDDKRFSPENAGSPYADEMLPHRRVRARSVYGGGTVTHWMGWVESINPAWNENGTLTSTLVGVGAKNFLQGQDVKLDLMEDVTADEVIQAVLEKVIMPPALADAWILGLAGNSELGVSTTLADTSVAYDMEVGKKSFSYVGDNWEEGVNAYQAIQSAVAGERGKFFIDRSGKAVFWNRHHLQLITNNGGTISDTMMGADYVYGASIYNTVRVGYHPRKISAAATEMLWASDNTITLEANEGKEINASFGEQDSDASVGGTECVTPNTGDGSLVVSEGDVSVTMSAAAQSADLSLVAGADGATITTLMVKGKKVTDYNAAEVEAKNALSITKYGRRVLDLDLELIDEEGYADQVARYELVRRKDPRGEMQSIQVGNRDAARITAQIEWTVGDRRRIVETQTQHDADYFIVGEEHELVLGSGSKHHTTTWHLEPASTQKGWLVGVVGRGELGQQTNLGF